MIRVLSRVFNEFTMWMWMINDSQHWIVSFYIHFIFTSSIKVDVIYLMSNQKNPNSNNNTITVEWIFKRAHCCRFAFFMILWVTIFTCVAEVISVFSLDVINTYFKCKKEKNSDRCHKTVWRRHTAHRHIQYKQTKFGFI